MFGSRSVVVYLGILLLIASVSAIIAATQRNRDGSVQIRPGESCPVGMTEVRPRTCRAPEYPPPSIVDYRPRSSLVTEEHMVPRARYPVVDIHGHASLGEPGARDKIATMVPQLDALNLRVYVAADNLSSEELRRAIQAINGGPHRDRFRVLAGIDFRNVGPGWGKKAAAQLEADIQEGAIGLGEVSKSFGLTIKKADGSRLKVDDPELDPVWETLARLKVPAFIHTAEPQEFFRPLNYENERWLELAFSRTAGTMGPARSRSRS